MLREVLLHNAEKKRKRKESVFSLVWLSQWEFVHSFFPPSIFYQAGVFNIHFVERIPLWALALV